MSSSERDRCTRTLERALGERVSVDADRLDQCAWDYGRLIHRRPSVVVAVHTVEELLIALRVGTEHNMPITTRGSGHSQSGQCLADGALVLDLKALNSVEIEPERGSGWLSGGATWHQVTDAAHAQGYMPLGLTMIVDTTVGGTLSVGGLSTESFRTGTQADQVLELEVVTLDGKVMRCSLERDRELFDAVRAGLGQCGVIAKARYPLRKAKARIRTYTLAYADGRALVADMQVISKAARCDFMFGGLLWNEQRGWQSLLFLGKEFGDPSELDDSVVLSGLQFQREVGRADAAQWEQGGRPGHPFFRRFVEQSSGILQHPWVDHLCEPAAAAELLTTVLSEPMVAPRPGTCGAMLNIAAHPNRAPLLPRASGPLVLLGLSPEVSSAAQLQEALVYMERFNKRGIALGAKRYLSGFMDGWTAHDWSAHFDETWLWFRTMKERFDARGLLNNACIRFH